MRYFDLNQSHSASLVTLLTGTFASRGDETQLIAKWIADPAMHGVVAWDDGVVGFMLASISHDFDPATYKDFDAKWTWPQANVAVLRIVAVSPETRRQGVARALAEALQVHLSGCSAWLGISWVHGGAHHSGHLFSGAGFDELGRCIGYYRRFHEQTGQLCPTCAPAICSCTAILYGRLVS